ncbi:MAG TPA: zf-HC2 domain-containing protein [Pyrinomonadaceae bacterium]
MNGNCLDIGTIQAFLDGETRPEQAVKISDHVADCDACAVLLAQAEEESSLVYSVLDRELNTLVPTQRLWSRINDSISEERRHTSVWQRISAFVSASLLSPSFAAAAGIVMVVAIGVVVWNLSSGDPVGQQIANVPVQQPAPAPVNRITNDEPSPQVVSANDDAKVKGDDIRESQLPERELQRIIRANHIERGPKEVRSVPASARFLPGEESYIRTIDDLQQSISYQNASMSASNQVDMARDIAIVDDSIQKMREVVRKNPRNQAARQVLYSTYQDKIDLLKASANRGELMASLQ